MMTLKTYFTEKELLGTTLAEWQRTTAQLGVNNHWVEPVDRVAFALCGHDRAERQDAIEALATKLDRSANQLTKQRQSTNYLEPLLHITYEARRLSACIL